MGHKSVAVALPGREARGVDLDGVIPIGAGNRLAAGDDRVERLIGGHLPGAGHWVYIATTGQHPRPEDHPVGQRVTAGDAVGKVRGSEIYR